MFHYPFKNVGPQQKVSISGFHVSQVAVLRPILILEFQEVLFEYFCTSREAEAVWGFR